MATKDWDKFWAGTYEAQIESGDVVKNTTIQSFWKNVFSQIATSSGANICLDIASGGGAVLRHFEESPCAEQFNIVGTDISHPALSILSKSLSQGEVVLSDASKLPFDSKSVSLMTSQFGIEYAGRDAFAEAQRVAAENSRIIFLMHHFQGMIYKQSKANLLASHAFSESNFLSYAKQTVVASFIAIKHGRRQEYDKAIGQIRPAINKVESIINKFGKDIAGGLISKILNDFLNIHDRIEFHREDELIKWLDRLAMEITGYEARMQSMLDAALKEDDFNEILLMFQQANFTTNVAQQLFDENTSAPIAWILDVSSKASA